MKMLRLASLLVLLFAPLSLYAQLGLYASFTTAKLGVPGYDNWTSGGTFGAYLARGTVPLVSYGIDLRGSFVSSSALSLDSGSAGPRIALNLHIVPIRPYLEATAGMGHADFSRGSSVTQFQYQILGGAEYTILPRIDWRVVEYSYGGLAGFSGTSFHPKSFSTGIVVRLPKLLPSL